MTTELDRPDPAEEGLLALSDYLEMFGAMSNEIRYHILDVLGEHEELSASELAEELGVEQSKFHYHLKQLTEVGLVENYRRDTAGKAREYSYYALTGVGRKLVETVDDLIEEEHALLDEYSTDGESAEASSTERGRSSPVNREETKEEVAERTVMKIAGSHPT